MRNLHAFFDVFLLSSVVAELLQSDKCVCVLATELLDLS